MADSTGSPGSHPHADRPNWQPADNADDYLRNCREGLEAYSQRRAAKLLGWSRAKVWRAIWASRLPEDLFERLMRYEDRSDRSLPSMRELASIARALYGDGNPPEADRCPHCRGLLRVRAKWTPESERIVNDWLAEGRGDG